MNSIFNRMSIRKFKEQSLSEEQITLLLKAAMAAPSAGNQQPWDFVTIKSKETMNKIMELSPYTQPLKQAPLAIVVCGDEDKEIFKGNWVQDCSAATQNILLQATEMGLGSVWLGIYPEQDRMNGLKELLNMPQSVMPLSIIAVGYPAENRKVQDRFKEERIHNETW